MEDEAAGLPLFEAALRYLQTTAPPTGRKRGGGGYHAGGRRSKEAAMPVRPIDAGEEVPPVATREETDAHLHNIYAYAWGFGLTRHQALLVVKLIALQASRLQDAVLKRLLESLIPRERIEEECFILILGCLGTLSPGVQRQALEWLVIAYDLLLSTNKAHRLYGVIFHWVDNGALRPLVCGLLYRMTRSQDVLAWRVNKLCELRNRVGSEPSIDALLNLYRQYRPSSVTVPLPRRTKPLGSVLRPTRAGRDIYQRIVELQGDPFVSQLSIGVSLFDPRQGSRGSRSRDKADKDTTSTKLSIDHFAQALERMEIPQQANTLFDSPFFHHYTALYPNRSLVSRLTDWLSFVLEEEVFWNDTTSPEHLPRLRYLLARLLDFGRANHGLTPALERFLFYFLDRWNGVDHAPEVLGLVSLVQGSTYSELQENVLNSLTTIFFTSSTLGKARLISCFTNIVRRWATLDWSDHAETAEESTRASFRHEEDSQAEESRAGLHISEVSTHYRPLYELIRYVDRMCVLGLMAERDHALVQHAALGFIEAISRLHIVYDVPMVIPPSEGLVYRLLYAHTAMPVSRVCAALVSYKSEFEHLKRKVASSEHLTAQSTQLNMYIWDFAVALWRQKLFASDTSPHAKRQYKDTLGLTDEMVGLFAGDHAPMCLSLTHGVAFSNFALEYMQAVERHAGRRSRLPLHPDMIKDVHRYHYVEFLKERGLEGLYEFLCTFVSSLRQRTQAQHGTSTQRDGS